MVEPVHGYVYGLPARCPLEEQTGNLCASCETRATITPVDQWRAIINAYDDGKSALSLRLFEAAIAQTKREK